MGWSNGKATAVLFAREGAKVLAADINLDVPLETKRIIEAEGGICASVRQVAGNVSRADDVAAIVDACIAKFGSTRCKQLRALPAPQLGRRAHLSG